MGSIEVTILGQKYAIKGDTSEDYLLKLASYVDGKMREVYEASPGLTPLKAAILASINIADELHKQRDEQDRAARTIEEKANVLSRLFD